MLARMYFNQLLRNKAMWGWGFFFISFWIVMGAYIFSKDMGSNLPVELYLSYTGSWFSICTILSFTSISVGLVDFTYSSSFSLRYLTKFSSLNPRRYYLSTLASSTTYSLFYVALLVLEVFALYSARFSVLLIPKMPLELVASAMLSAVFIYEFSAFLAYLALVLRKPKYIRFMEYLSLILAYPLIFLQLSSDIGILAIVSPFNAVNGLLYHYYSGLDVPKGAIASWRPGVEALSPASLWASLLAWILVMGILNIFLIRRQRGVSLDELRQA